MKDNRLLSGALTLLQMQSADRSMDAFAQVPEASREKMLMAANGFIQGLKIGQRLGAEEAGRRPAAG